MKFIGETPWHTTRAYGLVWPILGRLGRLDPSSNLGTPTICQASDLECTQIMW